MEEPAKRSLEYRMSELLKELEAGIANTAKKATVSDFIRLTQVVHELEDRESPSEVRITWIDRVEKSDTGT